MALPLGNPKAWKHIAARSDTTDMTMDSLPGLLKRLQDPARFDHPVEQFELLETHISCVLLTGPYAYKFKKPVNLGFLDFSTLEKRRFYCHEELRLNRRLAPDLYEAVVSITGNQTDPQIDGPGEVIEYAVRMRQFPRDNRLDLVCDRGELTAAHIDQLADTLADFHRQTPVAGPDSMHGTAATIAARALQNFEQIAQHCDAPEILQRLRPLKAWSASKAQELHEDFSLRHREGWIRECHGDLHLANCALIDGKVLMFDALEFAEDLRWIDPLSEIAFLYMDLDQRGELQLARRFLNRYLENANDYQSLNLLPYYLVYRALVRAKVAAIEAHQQRRNKTRRSRAEMQLVAYLDLAEHYSTAPARAPMILMHGLSGSGKSFLARQLVERLGAICIRSDVERKRLLGLAPEACTESGVAAGAYSPEITDKTYARLLALVYPVLDAGLPVIIDATFLRKSQRMPFQRLANVAGAPFVILSVEAPVEVLRKRVEHRNMQARDASEATLEVLEHQLSIAEPITGAEQPSVIRINSSALFDVETLAQTLLKQHQSRR